MPALLTQRVYMFIEKHRLFGLFDPIRGRIALPFILATNIGCRWHQEDLFFERSFGNDKKFTPRFHCVQTRDSGLILVFHVDLTYT